MKATTFPALLADFSQGKWSGMFSSVALAIPLLVVFVDTDSMFALSRDYLMAGTLLLAASLGTGQLARILSTEAASTATRIRSLLGFEALAIALYPTPAVLLVSVLCLSLRFWRNARLGRRFRAGDTRSGLLADLGVKVLTPSVPQSSSWAVAAVATGWLGSGLADGWNLLQGRVTTSVPFAILATGIIWHLTHEFQGYQQEEEGGASREDRGSEQKKAHF